MQEQAWWLRLPDGSRRRFGPAGVLVGRDPDCDIVLSDPGASRRQAMLHVSADGPQVVPLGRGPTEVSGRSISSASSLVDGDQISVPGLELTVETETLPNDDDESAAVWVVERVGGGMFGVGPKGVRIGSGPNDDVRIEECSEGVLTLRLAQGHLVLEANAEIRLRDELLEEGSIETLRSGDRFDVGDVGFRAVAAWPHGAASTQVDEALEEGPLPSFVRLVFLPRGGRLSLTIDGREFSVYLADRRCDLVASLLRPPEPYEAGDPVPDDVLMSKLWPRRDVTASALNVLLHRLRKDLVRAGVDGGTIIARAPGGGAVRFTIRKSAQVEVV